MLSFIITFINNLSLELIGIMKIVIMVIIIVMEFAIIIKSIKVIM